MVTDGSAEFTIGRKLLVLASIIEIFGPFPGGPAPLFSRTTTIVGSIGKSDRADETKVGILFTNSEPSEARQAANMMAHHGLLSTVARSHLEIVLTTSPLVRGEQRDAQCTFNTNNRKGNVTARGPLWVTSGG
jgi:hypothetical protein